MLIKLRGIVQPLVEAGNRRRPKDTIKAIEAAQAAERGEGDAPTGTHVDAKYAKPQAAKGTLPRVGSGD